MELFLLEAAATATAASRESIAPSSAMLHWIGGRIGEGLREKGRGEEEREVMEVREKGREEDGEGEEEEGIAEGEKLWRGGRRGEGEG